MKDCRCIYAIYKDISEEKHIVATIYTYAKYKYKPQDIAYIIYHNEPPADLKCLLQSIFPGEINFIPTGSETKKKLSTHIACINITGMIFENTNNSQRVAVVVYVYYYEYWMEIYNSIKLLSSHHPVDVHVYMCTSCSSLHSEHVMNCKQNDNLKIFFNWTQNKGRDVRSFLSFIKDKHYKKYSKICKIHTKKTTYLDSNWRSVYLNRLLHPKLVDNIWYKLDNGHNITSVDKFKIYEKHTSSSVNFKWVNQLIHKLGLDLKQHGRYNFYAGTMFWCSYNFCKYIDQKIDRNCLDQFEDEPIKNDGSLAHAWERVFSLL